jgi:hypothetical protein
MTQDEIIEMANKASKEWLKELPSPEETANPVPKRFLEIFAKLVAAKAIAELESQEPVAWLVEFENGEQELHFDKQSVGETQTPLYTHPPQRTEQEPTPEIKYKMIVIDDLHPQGIPVEQWVNPPQRTWVGLTVEEIADCCRESTTTQLSFYNAIEAKLKEKNNA